VKSLFTASFYIQVILSKTQNEAKILTGKNFVLCKNANLKIPEPINKHFSNKYSLLAITVVSQDTSDHTVIRFNIRSLRSRSKSQRQVLCKF
jgi:hypothetical protein